MSEPTDAEIREVFRYGCLAAEHLANRVIAMVELNRRLCGTNASRRDMLVAIEYTIDPVMNTLGDLLNGMEFVDDEDESSTQKAFALVRRVTKEPSRDVHD